MAEITYVPMVAAFPPSRLPVGAPPSEKAAAEENKTLIMLNSSLNFNVSAITQDTFPGESQQPYFP